MHRGNNFVIIVRFINCRLMFLIKCIPVKKLIILFQCQVRIAQSLVIILHLQVHTSQQSISSSQIRMNSRHGLCWNSHLNGFFRILYDKIIHFLNRNLRIRSINIRTGNKRYTTLLCCRSLVIRIGIIINQHIVTKCTYHFCIRHHFLSLCICSFCSCRCICDNQITTGNSSIKYIISPFIRIIQHNTVSRFIPHIIGLAQARSIHLRICQIYIIQQIQGIFYRRSADGILITQ